MHDVPYDGRLFFQSYYAATVRGEPADRMTIGAITEPEARFHYNAVENSIIRAIARAAPFPQGAAVEAWHALQRRQRLRLLDVGSGTGHWIDFFRNVFFVTEVVALELVDQMVQYLRQKYAGQADIRIESIDLGAEDPPLAEIGPVDYVSAIGVMFHVVDDDQWRRMVRRLAALLKPSGVMFVSDDLGGQTANVQFHKVDSFRSWQEYGRAAAEPGTRRVSKRVRSVADWHAAACEAGLAIVDLVRTDREPWITTPENDVLVLRRADVRATD